MDFSPLTKGKKQNEFRRNGPFLMIKYEPIRWIFVGLGLISDGLKCILTIQRESCLRHFFFFI